MKYVLTTALALGLTALTAWADESHLRLDRASFNPSIDETVIVSYDLPEDDVVTVRVYDTDHGLIRVVADQEQQSAGTNDAVWDGRDWEGRVVPDEAYTFVVTTESGEVLDPWSYSGGAVEDVTDAEFDAAATTVQYELPAPARVLIRFGVESGPLYKTLVHWEPRASGQVTEHWNGYDEDRLFRLRSHERFTALLTYVTLPEATVIAYGNRNLDYRDYKLDVAAHRPVKPKRPWTGPTLQLRPAGLVPPGWVRPPDVSMELLEGIPADSVGDRLPVRIDVSESDRQQLLDDQFEVIMYVDDVFYGEAERGHVPLNWIWELHQFEPGEHRLTVNVSSSRGLIGVVSREVTLKR